MSIFKKWLFLISMVIFGQNLFAQEAFHRVGQRVFYTPDASFAVISGQQSNPGLVCITFDVPRKDGAFVRCNIEKRLLAVVSPVTSISRYEIFLGLRVIYTLDGSFGYVTAVVNNTACVNFDKARIDGKFDRCNIDLNFLASTGRSFSSTTGQRIIYTPDASLGTLVAINFSDSTLCIKFDRPRIDGSFYRCNIPQHLIAYSK
jgi:hypothetical protein